MNESDERLYISLKNIPQLFNVHKKIIKTSILYFISQRNLEYSIIFFIFIKKSRRYQILSFSKKSQIFDTHLLIHKDNI